MKALISSITALMLLFNITPVYAEENIQHFEDWALRCIPNEETEASSKEKCFIFQRLFINNNDSKQLIMQINVLKLDEGLPVAVLNLPLGIYLPDGVKMDFDIGEPVTLQVERCVKGGCRARIEMDAQMRTAFRRSYNARVAFKSDNDNEVVLEVSLKGFNQAIKTLLGES